MVFSFKEFKEGKEVEITEKEAEKETQQGKKFGQRIVNIPKK